MRCTSPKTVGFKHDGKTICWSPNTYSREYATFQLPCGKCLSCRLETARQTAVRCVHEAQMHEKNAFITLTYSEENLKSIKLQYQDFQAFVKALRTSLFDDLLKRLHPTIELQKERRKLFNQLPKERRKELYEQIQISVFCAGEYGDKKKRPHWHALIFNWAPPDGVYKYSNARGDRIYSSDMLLRLWPHGISEYGSVTFQSAGYCARYASKKLSHGKDGTHDFEPIARRSTKHAIGKKWLEKYWPDIFNYGYVVLPDGNKCGIPRYYEKWFKKNHPEKWEHYIKTTKAKLIQDAVKKEEKLTLQEKKANLKRSGLKGLQVKRSYARNKILEQKFEQLQKHLKL